MDYDRDICQTGNLARFYAEGRPLHPKLSEAVEEITMFGQTLKQKQLELERELMETQIKSQVQIFFASVIGAGTSWGAFLSGEFLHGLLGNLTMLAGLLFTCIAGRYAWKIHRFKAKRAAMQLCQECIHDGLKPHQCLIPDGEQHPDCPLKRQRKIFKFSNPFRKQKKG